MRHTKLGRFEVVSPISRGGMADVYRCRLRGMGGFEKILVVKRIRADRCEDPRFVGMFLDEARLAAHLSHPNIVQVFEVGEADGAPYIAMEYVEGPTLATLMRRLWSGGRQPEGGVPYGHLVRIAADICAGLHEAHTARAPSGEPLGIVHRDVSPQNILVSRQGVAKLLDFGVAKANGRLTETQAGTLKGKLRYMAPEQLEGVVDARADVFALGVCLFEATVGASPFGPADAEEIALFKRIAGGRYARASALLPGYPPALEQILLAALDPDPARRCPTAGELHQRLEAFLAGGSYRGGAGAVAAWVNAICPEPADAGSPATAAAPGRPSSPTRTMTEGSSTGGAAGSRRSLAAVVGAASLLALVAGGLVIQRHGRSPRPEAVPTPALARGMAPPPSPDGLAPVTPPPTVTEWQLPVPPRPRSSSRRPSPRRSSPVPPPAAPAAPAAAVPAPVAAVAGIHSQRPRSPVRRPRLPRVVRLHDSGDVQRTLAAIELETLQAGCSPEFVRGITAPLARELAAQQPRELFASAIYYFIVREAGLGREKAVASAALAAGQTSGAIRALVGLPIHEAPGLATRQ